MLSILGAFAISTVSAISYGLLKKEMALRQVRIMADQDPLTHLYNRRAFTRIGEDLFRRARQEGTPLWAMMIDIDHFKSINDTFGHSAGDEIIADLAFIMAKVLPCHLTCRYGGEEFGALLTGLSDPQALETAEMIRAEAERASVMGISYTVSVGLAKLEGQKTMYALLDDADAALYRAKGLGRNRVELFHQDMIPRERDLEAMSADQGIGG
ncbi:GGDEF domain-containing protein [Thermanaerovibrio acidaminovorans]|uniref:GGDEF domain-containing protein n=1 Tax=Thermanaerovibrio acidaminovorans TaxID=81462 RepID=UPI0024917DAA|nr:GGDEF domain-containing protein [Thermanaerovibrio acidaminovorans]